MKCVYVCFILMILNDSYPTCDAMFRGAKKIGSFMTNLTKKKSSSGTSSHQQDFSGSGSGNYRNIYSAETHMQSNEGGEILTGDSNEGGETLPEYYDENTMQLIKNCLTSLRPMEAIFQRLFHNEMSEFRTFDEWLYDPNITGSMNTQDVKNWVSGRTSVYYNRVKRLKLDNHTKDLCKSPFSETIQCVKNAITDGTTDVITPLLTKLREKMRIF